MIKDKLTLLSLFAGGRLNLHLRLPVALIVSQPAVTSKAIVLPTRGDVDTNLIQEPASARLRPIMSNLNLLDLWLRKPSFHQYVFFFLLHTVFNFNILKSSQVRSGQVRSSQIKSGQVLLYLIQRKIWPPHMNNT